MSRIICVIMACSKGGTPSPIPPSPPPPIMDTIFSRVDVVHLCFVFHGKDLFVAMGAEVMSVDLFAYKTTNGSQVKLWPSIRNAKNQFWHLLSDGTIRPSIDSNKCLEAGRTPSLYEKAYVWDCHSGSWQKWDRPINGRIRSSQL